MEELTANKYDGVNFIIADYESGWAVHGGDDPNVTELIEGLNIISSFDLNDMRDERQKLARRLLTLQMLDSAVKFLAVSSKAFARPPAAPERPGMVVRGKERGTVSSTLIALGKKPRDAIFQYANGSPDRRGTRIIRRCCATSSAAACVNRGRSRRRNHATALTTL